MTDYAKKTVAELTEILKSKGLPHSGKKADLVARLIEADKAAEAPAPEPTEPTAPEPANEVPPPTDTSTAVPTAPASSAPPTATHQIDVDATAPADAPTPDTALAAATYKLDLPTSSVDEELKKRQARAARFGIPADAANTDKDGEAQRALERAKRFGTGESAMGKLDEALPMQRERKRGAEGAATDDPGLKGRGGGKRIRGRGGRDGGGSGRPDANGGGRQNSSRGEKPTGVSRNQPAFVSEKDRLAAEARKKKFATA